MAMFRFPYFTVLFSKENCLLKEISALLTLFSCIKPDVTWWKVLKTRSDIPKVSAMYFVTC